MRTLKVRVLSLGLALVIGGGFLGLVTWATVGASRAETARHKEVAERLFDAMEAELSDLVAREEQRSFLEYRSYYLPERNAKLGNVVRSPLTEAPTDPMITGYFQRDPDGTVNSPTLPRDNELALALDEGWRPLPTAERELERLSEALSGLAPGSIRAATKAVVSPRAAPSTPLSKLASFGANRRSGRGQVDQQLNAQSLEVYNTQTTIQNAYQNADEAPSGDVRISPFRGVTTDAGLLLYRSVEVGGQSTLQGFVVDVEGLQRTLYERVIVASQLEDVVNLVWDDGPVQGAWSFEHTFGEPFGGVALTVGMDRIPGVASMEQQLLWGISIGGLFVLMLVGAALWWAVRAELLYAQRRSDFVAAVSHELKTPLTSIRMYAEMLRDGMVPDPERQAVYHGTITAEAERLTRLIANVLELSRMEQGAPRPEPVAGDLNTLVTEAVTLLRPHATASGVEIRVDLPTLPPVQLERDALVQIVMNLVDNAIKFGGQGEVVVTARRDGTHVVLLVRDHGPGVPRKQLRHIFEPFYRGERELTRTTKGTGIGLALVQGLMRDMGGRVQARNHPEGGLEVALSLVVS